jgi:hypothetical protein
VPTRSAAALHTPLRVCKQFPNETFPLHLQYCSRDERDATAAEVGAGGLLRYVGTGEPVHTLSAEDSDMLVRPRLWQ